MVERAAAERDHIEHHAELGLGELVDHNKRTDAERDDHHRKEAAVRQAHFVRTLQIWGFEAQPHDSAELSHTRERREEVVDTQDHVEVEHRHEHNDQVAEQDGATRNSVGRRRRETEIGHAGQLEAVLGHLGDVHAEVSEDRAHEEPGTQTRARYLLGDDRVKAVGPEFIMRFVDARGREKRNRVRERDEKHREHHRARVRLAWGIDLACVRTCGIEAAVAPVQYAHELTPLGLVSHDEPVSRIDLRYADDHEHDEWEDHRDAEHEKEAADGVDAVDRRQHERRRDDTPNNVHPQRHQERLHAATIGSQQHGEHGIDHEARVDRIVDHPRNPGPVANVEPHRTTERLADPCAEARVRRKRREEFCKREREREAPDKREDERCEDANERSTRSHDRLRSPRPTAYIELVGSGGKAKRAHAKRVCGRWVAWQPRPAGLCAFTRRNKAKPPNDIVVSSCDAPISRLRSKCTHRRPSCAASLLGYLYTLPDLFCSQWRCRIFSPVEQWKVSDVHLIDGPFSSCQNLSSYKRSPTNDSFQRKQRNRVYDTFVCHVTSNPDVKWKPSARRSSNPQPMKKREAGWRTISDNPLNAIHPDNKQRED
ncbi:hypothetical protein FI667_g9304, partial [Globisporangium splendens]